MSKPTIGWRRVGLSSLATTSLVLGTCLAGVGAASADTDFSFTRIGGDNRYETAVDVSDEFGDASNVILANGEQGHFPDALVANYLAGVQGAPVLLTKSDKMPQDTMDKLTANSTVKTVTIVGGEDVVGADQAQWLEDQGYTVKRIAGHNRYDTAAAVINEAGDAASTTAIITTGVDFPDALAGGPLSYHEGMPMAISKADDIRDSEVDALVDSGVSKFVVLGGAAVVGQDVVDELEDAGLDFDQRLAGDDRAETSVEVAEYAIDTLNFDDEHVNVASGYIAGTGADALAGGPLTGKQVRPMLITKSNVKAGDSVLGFLEDHANTLQDGIIFGLEGAVSQGVEDAMEEAAQSVTTNQAYSADPAAANSVTNRDGQDQKVTFSGIDAEQVSVRLVDCDQVTVTDNGTVSFKDTAGDANEADLAPAANSDITGINGVFSTYGDSQDNVDVNDDGTLTVTVDSTDAGCSRVVIFNDADNQNDLDLAADDTPTEDFAVSGRLLVTNPDAVDASPENATNPYGESHTVTAQLIDQTAAPDDDESSAEAGVAVRFSRYDGACPPAGTPTEVANATTDAKGQATYSFTAQDPNTAATGDTTDFCVLVEADTDRDGVFEPGDTVSKTFTDTAPVATNVKVTPADATNPVGSRHTVTATVTDQYGSPVAGQEVDFVVDPSGTAANLSTTRTTDANGEATFTYAGPTDTANNDARDDVITATADDNNNAVTDPADPFGTANKEWVEAGAINQRTGKLYPQVQPAIDEAKSGDTITVFGGGEGAYDNLDGFNVTKPLVIEGTNGGTNGNGTQVNGAIAIVGVDNVTVRGLDIVPGTTAGSLAGIYLDNAEGIVLTKNEVLGAAKTGAGIINATGGDVEAAQITNNTFRTLLQGVYANPTAKYTIDSNLFDGNEVGSANDEASTITNNTFRNGSTEAVGLNAAGSTVTGNSFADNVAHVSDYTAGSVYDLNAMIGANTFDEPVEVVPATDGPGVEQIVPQDGTP